MKALSIQNPMAVLVAAGIKDVENRGQRTNYRGRILIHSCGEPCRWVNISDCPRPFQGRVNCHIDSNTEHNDLPDDIRRFDDLQRMILSFHGLDDGCTDEQFNAAMMGNPAIPSHAIIGEVDIVDCVYDHDSEWAAIQMEMGFEKR